MKKLPNLICTRTVYYFDGGWEVIWYPKDVAKQRGGFDVTVKYHHEGGGDSVSYGYPGPASRHSSEHLIKWAFKEKDLPKK